MLALRVTQKDGTFYIAGYRAEDLLKRVKFLSRYCPEGEEGARVEAEPRPGEEEIVGFIRGVERREGAFQRGLVRRKVRDIMNFYETAQSQPMVPGPVLLYTPERLGFSPIGGHSSLGNLSDPSEPFLIVDGQHRLAALDLFMRRHAEGAGTVEVPVIVFDGRMEDFAAEMFVIINSTQTRINRSHLVDLMERVTYGASPEARWAAWVVKALYEDARSPLRYRVNRLGGRSRQEKWVLQSELFNEVHRLVAPPRERRRRAGAGAGGAGGGEDAGSARRFVMDELGLDRRGERAPTLFIAYLRAARSALGEAWEEGPGTKRRYMATTSVVIKALVRALGDLLGDADVRRELREAKGPEEWERAFARRVEGWREMAPDLRREGFYERFAAKGQVERVRVVQRELGRRLLKS